MNDSPATATVEEVLEALRFDWSGFYLIGFDDECGWWATRRGQIGDYFTAHGPDELRAALADDFGPLR